MKLDVEKMGEKSPKQLRTLRNQLNNRISAFQTGKAPELKESHPLSGMDLDQCQNILIEVKKLLRSL